MRSRARRTILSFLENKHLFKVSLSSRLKLAWRDGGEISRAQLISETIRIRKGFENTLFDLGAAKIIYLYVSGTCRSKRS